MKDGLPSKTAALVAAFRGLAELLPDRRLASLAPDPYALQLAGWPYTWLFALARLPLLRPLLLSRFSMWGRGAGFLAARTRVLDDVVRDAVKQGCTNVLVLGAGLDSRALRLADELGSGVQFYEVDHPASQAYKREQLRGHTGGAVYVAFDFEAPGATTVGKELQRQGFDAGSPSVVLLEGLLMYLTPETVEQVFATTTALCAPGSRVAFTFLTRTPDRPTPRLHTRLLELLNIRLFMLWLRYYAHEPWTFWGWPNREALAGFVGGHHMRLLWEDSYVAVARRSAGLPESALPGRRVVGEHCAVAERL
jgi:methyltransferase (TIGR00027 family)